METSGVAHRDIIFDVWCQQNLIRIVGLWVNKSNASSSTSVSVPSSSARFEENKTMDSFNFVSNFDFSRETRRWFYFFGGQRFRVEILSPTQQSTSRSGRGLSNENISLRPFISFGGFIDTEKNARKRKKRRKLASSGQRFTRSYFGFRLHEWMKISWRHFNATGQSRRDETYMKKQIIIQIEQNRRCQRNVLSLMKANKHRLLEVPLDFLTPVSLLCRWNWTVNCELAFSCSALCSQSRICF